MLKKMILALENYTKTRPPQMQKLYKELQEEIPLEDDQPKKSMRRGKSDLQEEENEQQEDQT